MTRHQTPLGPLTRLCGTAFLVVVVSSARAESPELVIRQLFQANPITAPYNLMTYNRGGQVVIVGAVGSKQIHDIAIRMAINSGYPIRDDLVIDTALARRVAIGPYPGQGPIPPYVYPPTLFGRNDPFYGLEPPLLTYPPWWRAVAARAQAGVPYPTTAIPQAQASSVNVMPSNASGVVAGGAPSTTAATIPLGQSPQGNTVEMTIDPRGVAVLRGTVPTLADRIAIGQKIAQAPGVLEVLNLLNIADPTSPENQPQAQQQPQQQQQQPQQQQPPPLQPPAAQPPAGGVAPQDANAGALEPAVVIDGGVLNDRLTQAFAHRPALAGLPIKVTVRDGTATLTGKVPTVYEAMLAFRVVEQLPGIRDVIDRLEFVVPDGERQNPLIKQGRPEDVEPYLSAQIRRNLGDLAHLDRIRLLGDTLELWGTLIHAEDRPRLDATLRSIAVLRGFRLESHFQAE